MPRFDRTDVGIATLFEGNCSDAGSVESMPLCELEFSHPKAMNRMHTMVANGIDSLVMIVIVWLQSQWLYPHASRVFPIVFVGHGR